MYLWKFNGNIVTLHIVCIVCISSIFGINFQLLLAGFLLCLTLENKEVSPNHSSVLLHVTSQVIPSTVARVIQEGAHISLSNFRSSQIWSVCYYWFYTDMQLHAMGRCFFIDWLLSVCFSTGHRLFLDWSFRAVSLHKNVIVLSPTLPSCGRH